MQNLVDLETNNWLEWLIYTGVVGGNKVLGSNPSVGSLPVCILEQAKYNVLESPGDYSKQG